MKNHITRTRFAPSPSGIMHIGNLRSALISFLCAKENNGSFILRIEDTDQTRTQQHFLDIIYEILNIFKLYPDEGPEQNGPYSPYIQSQRNKIYDKYLNILFKNNLIYRCFTTQEELEKIKNEQIALKLPPRYQRPIISEKEEELLLQKKEPFIWRLSLPNIITTIEDKVKGKINYDLNNFSDCPITRNDFSYTFLFANFIDDVEMKITYIIRGEEHLSNTAIQSYLYDVLKIDKPLFYHLPLLCDKQGKKLSKRNFGFNIQDLLQEGYLPEAIINYIAIIGSNFKSEIMSLDEMINNKIFTQTKSSGLITYDQEKLLWINSKWMQKIDTENFIYHLKQYKKNNLEIIIPESKYIINDIRQESKTIKDFCKIIFSIFESDKSILIKKEYEDFILYIKEKIINTNSEYININEIKAYISFFSKNNNYSEKKLYNILRQILINTEEGISLSILFKHIKKENILIKLNSVIFK
jgi:glutamyl-tRNA synthetase